MPTMTALVDMTDTELLEECQKAVDALAFYNAADGDAYQREASDRENMRMRWRAVASECLRRGLQPKFVLM